MLTLIYLAGFVGLLIGIAIAGDVVHFLYNLFRRR